jgi:hypothetical protein
MAIIPKDGTWENLLGNAKKPVDEDSDCLGLKRLLPREAA